MPKPKPKSKPKKRDPNPLRLDPSRTTMLRRNFERAVVGRFRNLSREVVELIGKQDVLGLTDNYSTSQPRDSRGRFGSGGGGGGASAKQTESKEFKDWFGKSKIVDEKGEPLVVYHGSSEKFEEFDPALIGSNQEGKLFAGRGFYFSDDPASAAAYGDKVYPVYLKADSVLDLTDKKDFHESFKDSIPRGETKTLGKITEEYDKASKTTRVEDVLVEEVRPGFFDIQWKVDGEWRTRGPKSPISRLELSDDPTGMALARKLSLPKNPNDIRASDFTATQITRAAKAKGAQAVKGDASIFQSGNEYVVFKPTQIKSATGNEGAFDPNDPNIYNVANYSASQPRDSRGRFGSGGGGGGGGGGASVKPGTTKTKPDARDVATVEEFQKYLEKNADKWFLTPDKIEDLAYRYGKSGVKAKLETLDASDYPVKLNKTPIDLDVTGSKETEQVRLVPSTRDLDDLRKLDRESKINPNDTVFVRHQTTSNWEEEFLEVGLDTRSPPPDSRLGRLTLKEGNWEQSRITEAGLFVEPNTGDDYRYGVIIQAKVRDMKPTLESKGLGYKTGTAGLYGAKDAIISDQVIPPEQIVGVYAYENSKPVWKPNPKNPNSGKLTTDDDGKLILSTKVENVHTANYSPGQPRDSRGRFGSGGGGGGSSTKPTETKEFKEWFGKSKIVDENGEPLTVYHGTTVDEDFAEFSMGEPAFEEEDEFLRVGSGGDPTTYLGSHFAKEPEVADKFAKGLYGERVGDRVGGRVYPVHLKVEKPFVTEESTMQKALLSQKVNTRDVDAALEEAANGNSAKMEEYGARYDKSPSFRRDMNQKAMSFENDSDQPTFDTSREMAEQYRKGLQKKGYDGIVYKNEIEGGTSYVVFEGTQIKSALGNRGTFDPNDPNIANVFTSNVSWKFKASYKQLQLFQLWLAKRIQADILLGASATEDAYWEQYVKQGFAKGAGRAFADTKTLQKKGEALAETEKELDFYKGSQSQFLQSAFGRPVAKEKVKLLAARVYTSLNGVTQAMATAMSHTLTDGMVQGKHPRQIAKDLAKNVAGIGINRARAIARTEIMRAHAEGQLDAMKLLGVKQVGAMVEWSTAGDGRVCPLCRPLGDAVLTLDEAEGLLPRHPNCLPGNSLVTSSSRIAAASKRHYEGELVVICTASGRKLSCTPNHPILTDFGWTPANLLNVGSYVVCDGGSEWELGKHNNNQKVPACIEDVASSIAESSSVSSAEVPLSSPDFHGDAIDGDVAVIWADSLLLSALESPTFEHVEELDFLGRNANASSRVFLKESSLAEFLVGPNSSTSSFISGSGLSGALATAHLRPLEQLSLASTTGSNSGLKQHSPNHSPRHAAQFSNRLLRLPSAIEFQYLVKRWSGRHCLPSVMSANSLDDGLSRDPSFTEQASYGAASQVFLDKVVSVKTIRFAGHVFNLQTELGWYTAQGIITHNCRCTWIPANVGEDEKKQKRSQASIRAAITKSLQAELPKKAKGKGAKSNSSWGGATQPIAKKRPKALV